MEHNFTFKGKPSVQADFQPSKEDLEYIDSIEKKYAKNKTITSEEIVKYFDVTKTKIRSALLNDVLSKHNTYVDRRAGVKGPGLSTVKETKNDPNRRKKSIQDAFNKAIEEAMQRTKQLREASVTIAQAKQETVKESEIESTKDEYDAAYMKELEALEQKWESMKNVQGFGFGTEDLPHPSTVSRNDWLKEYMPYLIKGLPDFKFDEDDYSKLSSAFGNDNPFAPDSPLMKLMEKYAIQTEMHDINWSEGIRELFEDKSEATKMMLEQIAKEAEVELDRDIISDPIDFKPLATAFTKYLPKYLENLPTENSDIKRLLDTSEAILDPLEFAIKTWEKHQVKEKPKSTKKKPKTKATAITKQEVTKESEQSPIETPEQTSVEESVQGMPLFEEAAKTYDPIEDARSKEEERQKKLKAQEDADRKAIEDAIKPVTNDIIESLNNQMPVTPTSSGGGGGSGKKPPKTAKGSDDDGGDDEGDSNYFDDDGTYNPRRYFKAQVENLQRSFDAKLFGEKESTYFSSLQKVFDRASRTEDYDELEKLIEQETRLQSKILKDFETSNQNTANLLQAKAEEMIIRESNAKEEDRDTELIAWLENRLQEIKDVREATTSEYERIQRAIQTEIRNSAMKGFASGSIERDIRKLEQEAKDEEKILSKFNREFNKYVTAENQRLASEQAFEASKSFIDANKGKMPQEELLGKARKLFDKEFATYMQTASTEPELTTEQIVEKYQEGEGSFQQDAFKVKNAPSGFGQKSKYDPTKDDYIAPDRRSLTELAKDDSERQRIKKNLAVWGTIQGVMGPLNQASKNTTGTGTVSGVMQNASAGAFALSAMGKAGPYGTLIAASLQTVSLLGEIADNTAKNVEAFSPEIIMANVESRLLRLNQNMAIGSSYGDKLADYQRSQSAISRQMYELGVDLFGIFQPFITFVVDVLTSILSVIGFIATVISLIASILDPILKTAGRFFRDTGEYIRRISNWLTGSKDQEIPNYTKEFMQNDPRQNFIHHE